MQQSALDWGGAGLSNELTRPLGEVLRADGTTLDPAWRVVLAAWLDSPAGQRLVAFVEARQAQGAHVVPRQPLRALQGLAPSAVRVVILGQDPYHGEGQAEGLAFSVPAGMAIPPSLRNIDLELQRDLHLAPPGKAVGGHLGVWVAQGVMLLNTSLSVELGSPGSHAKQGWEALTDACIQVLAQDIAPKVFMLWGAHAQAKRALIDASTSPHLVLEANHPSPLSARRCPMPFIGCGHFSKARDWLAEHGAAIDWRRT